jgi:hypothetical protein
MKRSSGGISAFRFLSKNLCIIGKRFLRLWQLLNSFLALLLGGRGSEVRVVRMDFALTLALSGNGRW